MCGKEVVYRVACLVIYVYTDVYINLSRFKFEQFLFISCFFTGLFQFTSRKRKTTLNCYIGHTFTTLSRR